MAQAGSLVVCGDAGEALGDSIYEARLYVRGDVARASAPTASRRRWRDEHVAELARAARARRRRRRGRRREFRRYGSARRLYNSTSTTPASMTSSERRPAGGTRPARVGDLRPPHDRRDPARRARRASTTSAASAPSASVPHFDDLLFLGAACRAIRSRAIASAATPTSCSARASRRSRSHLEIPITIAGMSFGALSAPAKEALGRGATRGGHLDHDRRRRHDARGARALEARSSTSCCRRATA